jgi:hypothetical protein
LLLYSRSCANSDSVASSPPAGVLDESVSVAIAEIAENCRRFCSQILANGGLGCLKLGVKEAVSNERVWSTTCGQARLAWDLVEVMAENRLCIKGRPHKVATLLFPVSKAESGELSDFRIQTVLGLI